MDRFLGLLPLGAPCIWRAGDPGEVEIAVFPELGLMSITSLIYRMWGVKGRGWAWWVEPVLISVPGNLSLSSQF